MKRLYKRIVIEKWEGKERYGKEIDFLKEKKKMLVFPYKFQDKYQPEPEWIGEDEKGIFTYTKDDEIDRKLYFCGEREFVANKYRNLRREQDEESPHRYFTKSFYPNKNDVFVDVGAAEGKEALSLADTCKKIYLFEANNEWVKALNKTFFGNSSVYIYNCFVGAVDDARKNMIKLDTIFENLHDEDIFLKLDVEGMEKEVLEGAAELIKNNNVRMCVTVYHRQNDALELKAMLENMGLCCTYSENYMVYLEDKNIRPPYFRHGIIRAFKYMGST